MDGGNQERERFVMFHPRLAVMCLTAAVTDGRAAAASGAVSLFAVICPLCWLERDACSSPTARRPHFLTLFKSTSEALVSCGLSETRP